MDWYKAGQEAFARGAHSAPSLDPDVRAAIEGLPVGGGAVEIFREWNRGWMDANLAAPIDEEENH